MTARDLAFGHIGPFDMNGPSNTSLRKYTTILREQDIGSQPYDQCWTDGRLIAETFVIGNLFVNKMDEMNHQNSITDGIQKLIEYSQHLGRESRHRTQVLAGDILFQNYHQLSSVLTFLASENENVPRTRARREPVRSWIQSSYPHCNIFNRNNCSN